MKSLAQDKKKGLILIYTGNGKGKTSAAVGLAVRAAGYDQRVGFFQFIKSILAFFCPYITKIFYITYIII